MFPVAISFSKLKRGKGRRSRIVADDDKAEIETGKSSLPDKPVSNPDGEKTPSSVENDSSLSCSTSNQPVNPSDKPANPVEREEYQPECEDVSRMSSPVEQDIPPLIQNSNEMELKVENETSEDTSNQSEMLEAAKCDSIQTDQAPVSDEMMAQTASANRKRGRQFIWFFLLSKGRFSMFFNVGSP